MGERVRRYAYRGLLAVLWAGAAYYLVFGGVYSIFDLWQLEEERERAVERVDSLIAVTDSLVQRGDSLVSDTAAIERTAREEYGLIRDGEILVRFHETGGKGEAGTVGNGEPEVDEE